MAAPMSQLHKSRFIFKFIKKCILFERHRPLTSTSTARLAKDDDKREPKLDSKLITAAKDAAGSLPGDRGQTNSDLLGELLRNAGHTQRQRGERDGRSRGVVRAQPEERSVISSLLSEVRPEGGMSQRRDQSDDHAHEMRPHTDQARRDENTSRHAKKPIGLFDAEPLNIFTETTTDTTLDEGTPVSLWDTVEGEMFERLRTQVAKNQFEEMIEWTKEGKMWSFPLDNEQGWDERQVPFHEHVLLDDLIADFPRSGPVRHFMELVVVGLGKNPYITVADKHAHIQWFREYFASKQHIFDELSQPG